MTGSRSARIASFAGDAAVEKDDLVAHEEPLELQIQGVSCAVVMRTPGDDEDLAIGFLVSERVIERLADVVSARHCSAVSEPEAEENVMRIVLADGVEAPLERLRRNLYASSSCGICGKATIEAAMACTSRVKEGVEVDASTLYRMPAALRRQQSTFDETGGLHAAGLFGARGDLLLLREDVGRHNAVDKIIGAALRSAVPLERSVLLVSGRVSFEVVQKAATAGISLIAGVSAPTSLAIRFGEALNVTVIGFLRGETMNVYCHARRVRQRT